MQQLPGTLRSGQHVDARGEPWRVVDVDVHAAAAVITLRGTGDRNRGDVTRLLTPFDCIVTLAPRRRLRRRRRRLVLEEALAAMRGSIPWSECRAAQTAHLDHRDWQRDPARAVIAGATRVLLADGVGLGKTIQALLIATELEARGLVRRILVLTPAALREQWAGEMSRRFGRRARVFDHVSLAAAMARLPAGVNPWSSASPIISSIDLVKRAEVRQAIDRATFDLLIVDEAHHLTPGSDRAAIVADLAVRTPFVVLVTATPHSGDGRAYRFLCDLGHVEGGEEIRVFRRAAQEVDHPRARRTRIVAVPPTEAERDLLEATLAYAQAVWRGPGGPHARLVAAVIARRACSWADAARRTVARRLAMLRGTPEADDQPRLPWDEDVQDDDVPQELMGLAGLADRAVEIDWLVRLSRLAADAARRSSKATYVRRLLQRSRESLLVFSEYRDTAIAVAASLADVSSVAVLHGGLSPSERRDLVDLFTQGQIRTLVTTDAAGEGLNLQARCRLVVTLELPWNPLRLEQRVGRVDRLGQTRRVHARHLVHRGSFEDIVLGRLERRRETARGEIDEAAWTEEAIAAAVLAEPPGGDPDRPVERARSAPRSDRRGSASGMIPAREDVSHDSQSIAPAFASTPPKQPVRGVSLLFAADVHDAAGRVLRSELIGVRYAVDPSVAPRRLSRQLVAMLATRSELRGCLENALEERVQGTRAAVAPAAARINARIETMRAAMAGHLRPTWVQASLFDHRAEDEALARAAVGALWRAHLEWHAEAARALASPRASDPRLVAAWLDAGVR